MIFGEKHVGRDFFPSGIDWIMKSRRCISEWRGEKQKVFVKSDAKINIVSEAEQIITFFLFGIRMH